MLSRRKFLGLGTATLSSLAINPLDAFSWGAINRIAPTHQIIAKNAHDMVIRDATCQNVMIFPNGQEILKHDWVALNPINMDHFVYGTGPDVEGMTPYSWHYWNPQKEWGQGPYAVGKHFQELAKGIRINPNGPGAAKSASWTSHFIADMHVPYHVFGIPSIEAHRRFQRNNYKLMSNESGPSYLYGGWNPPFGWGEKQDFRYALLHYTKNHPLDKDGKPKANDWFDPWYFNGIVRDVATGSHASWELSAYQVHWNIQNASQLLTQLCSKSYYDPLWENRQMEFGRNFWGPAQEQAKTFAHLCAYRTVEDLDDRFKFPVKGIVWAIRAAATLFRASMSTLTVQVKKENKGPNKTKFIALVGNNNPQQNVQNVSVRFMIEYNGKWRKTIKKIGTIYANNQADVSWNLNTSKFNGNRALIEVSGLYPNNTPDLGYVNQSFTINKDQYQPEPEPEPQPTPADGCPIPEGAKIMEGSQSIRYFRKVRGEGRQVGPYIQWYDNERTQLMKKGCLDGFGQPIGLQDYYKQDGTHWSRTLYRKGKYIKDVIRNGRQVK